MYEPRRAVARSNCRHSARTAQFGQMCHREIEMQRYRAVQSREMPTRSPEIEISESPNATRFYRTARVCAQAMRAQFGFRLSRKRRAVSPVGAGATGPAHDRYLSWSKKHLRSECCAMRCGAAVTASRFRFAGTGQAMRLLTTSSEILPCRRRSRCSIASEDQFFPRAPRRSLHRHSSIAAVHRRPRCRGYGSESTELMVQFPVRSDRAGVTGAFKKDWHPFKRRLDPPFFRSHESRSSIKSYAIRVNLFFDEGSAMRSMRPGFQTSLASRFCRRATNDELRFFASLKLTGHVVVVPPLARPTFAWHKTTLTRFSN